MNNAQTSPGSDPALEPGSEAASEPAPTRGRRVPFRKRPMPCPRCDGELTTLLPRGSSGEASSEDSDEDPCACPHCGAALLAVEGARFWRQLAAATIDVLALALAAGPIAWGLHRLIDPLPLAPGARGLDLALSLFAADFGSLLQRIGPLLVLAGLYFMVTISWTGRTLGHRLLSLRIIDAHGRQPNAVQAALRTIMQLLGTLAAALGPLWAMIDSERRALHDLVAGTYVVRSA